MTKNEMVKMIGPRTTNLAKVLYFLAGKRKPVSALQISEALEMPLASVRGALATNRKGGYGKITKSGKPTDTKYTLTEMVIAIDPQESIRKRVESRKGIKEEFELPIDDRLRLINQVFC